MGATSGERYAVVSCHVERPLDDAVWARFASLQARRPGGFAVAALVRPRDEAAGEDAALWLERAREAAGRGPLGHHTHWTAPDHARPTAGGAAPGVTATGAPATGVTATGATAEGAMATGVRVLCEGRWLRENGLSPTLFCGGGWYTDAEVADACAELGYVDCTPRALRPPYLPAGAPWAELDAPARLRLASGRSLPAIPTTHSLGDLARALLRRAGRGLPAVTHVYFHDTDLLDRRRRALLAFTLSLLARCARPTDLDALARTLGPTLAACDWDDVARS